MEKKYQEEEVKETKSQLTADVQEDARTSEPQDPATLLHAPHANGASRDPAGLR